MNNPHCGACGMLNHQGFCSLTACRFPMVNTVVGYVPPLKKTNADCIRAMSDEELADEILSWFNWLNAVEWNDKRILDWLKQEVSE